jgi:hypothetical protein
MKLPALSEIITRLGPQAQEDIEWAESIGEPPDAEFFALETIYIICNSGMRFTIARQIYDRVCMALRRGDSASAVFGHKGKAGAIDYIWNERQRLFEGFKQADDRLLFLASLPWIGDITKYHLAKNFGMDVAKPDVHLQRLADLGGITPQQLCEALAAESGYRVATVDTLLWRACALGIIDSRTGLLVEERMPDPVQTSLLADALCLPRTDG